MSKPRHQNAFEGRSMIYRLQHRLILHITVPTLAIFAFLMGCGAPTPTPSPLVIPTRASPTPTPTQIPAQYYYEAGREYRATGDIQEALRLQTQALGVDPGFAPAYIERAILHRALEAPQAALADAQAAIATDPENATAYALMGEILRLEFNDPLQSLAAYDRAVRLDQTLAEATFLARWQTAVAANQPGRMVLLANEYADSHPDDPLAPYYRARALTALGNSSGAVETLSGALEETSLAALWLALGDAYTAEEAWGYALTCYEQARGLTEEGDNSLNLISEVPAAELFGSLGTAYLYTGRCSDARNMLNHALAIGPDRPEYHTLLGQAMICLTPTPVPTPYPLLNQ